MSNPNTQEKTPLTREGDGVTHINVWSRARTTLGQQLSNFAHLPFSMPEFGTFASVEAFWFWLATGKTHQELRRMYGSSARQLGKKLVDEGQKVDMPEEEFQDCIRKALRCKLEQHADLREAFILSTLPFEHYYVYGKAMNVIVDKRDRHGWQTDYLEQLRAEWRAERNLPTHNSMTTIVHTADAEPEQPKVAEEDNGYHNVL